MFHSFHFPGVNVAATGAASSGASGRYVLGTPMESQAGVGLAPQVPYAAHGHDESAE